MGQSPPSDSYNKEKLGLPFFQGKADFGDYFPTAQIWCSAPKKIAKPNDILISVRAPVGPVNLSNQKCCIGRGLSALRPNEKLNFWFLFFHLKEIENSWKGSGSTFEAIKKHDLDIIRVPAPPYSVQESIVSEIRKKLSISKSLQSLTQIKINSLDALLQAILKRAFRGEL
jgi:type I restriction enzyme S subunit